MAADAAVPHRPSGSAERVLGAALQWSAGLRCGGRQEARGSRTTGRTEPLIIAPSPGQGVQDDGPHRALDHRTQP
ncbi:hypothetical protein AB4Z54_62810, partial [Streptomyces sp. MCAF7]